MARTPKDAASPLWAGGSGQTDQHPPIRLTQESPEPRKERNRRTEQPEWGCLCVGYSRRDRENNFWDSKTGAMPRNRPLAFANSCAACVTGLFSLGFLEF